MAEDQKFASIQYSNPQRDTVRKVFYRGNLPASDTLLYTSPNLPGARSEVLQLIFCNTSSGAETINLHSVPKGGSSGVDNAVFYEYSFAANATGITDSLSLILEEGDMLRGQASTTGKFSVIITGLVEMRPGGLA
ncbi:hypothetical protein CMI48_05050 [Candidatus Pacearchaeota archaeon]|nr:hypothetical protein [Candidatus Pacearchaeota archaeon]|tara:strand:- start:1311 stop:1715 length:405 start_codon:yes stop_codon:yes gene_type:complete